MNIYNPEDIYIMYLRKSRADETCGIENIMKKHEDDLQLLAMRELGFTIPEKYIFREIVSGETIKDRPLMNEVLKLMETGKVKAVLVVDPQRLTRGDLLDQGHIVNAFRYTDTLIMTPFKTYDLNDPHGNDMKLFKMEIDHGADYLDYFKMIQKRGKTASVRNGNYIANRFPYGYESYSYQEGSRKIRTLSPIPEESENVKMMFAAYADGRSIGHIKKTLNDAGIKTKSGKPWTTNAVTRVLSNPVYIGKIRWGYKQTVRTLENGELIKHRISNNTSMIVDGLHEPIIDRELFEKVQERLKNNTSGRITGEIRNPLAGLMFCGSCGKRMNYYTSSMLRTDGSRYKTFRYGCDNQSVCHTKSIKSDKVIEAVCEALSAVISDFETIIPSDVQVIDLKAEKRHIQALLDDLSQKEETMYELLETRVYTTDTFNLRHASLEKQRQELNAKLLELESMNQESRQFKKAHFIDALKALQSPSVPAKEKNALLKMCIENIIYYVDESSKENDTQCKLDIQFKL